MPATLSKVKDSDNTYRAVVTKLGGGWSTASYPTEIADNECQVLDNFIRLRDDVWSLRPGNINYGSGTGATGSGVASLAGTRFYFGNPVVGQLCVQSGGHLYTGNDSTGAFTSRNASLSSTQPATFAQMYDPDNTSGAATSLFICDGSRIPQIWDGTNFIPVQTGTPFLPVGTVSGVSIKPLYVTDWNYSLVYANESTDPTAVWISDQLRPERFSGTSLTDSALQTYIPYYPGGRNSSLGVITGIRMYGQYLIVFYTAGIVAGYNTGSYGTYQYVWTTLSRSLGCTSPTSIVAMDMGVFFFGGDRFYMTDGQYLYPLPDKPQTLYNNDSTSQQPPEITNATTVSAARRGLSYLAAYQSNQGNTFQDRVACFDTQAAGGVTWQPVGGTAVSSGGAWSRFVSGMPMSWGIECRGPGDVKLYPFFWGLANADTIAQFDAPMSANTDFGNGIFWEIRTKSFFFDQPQNPKMVTEVWPITVFPTSQNFVFTTSPYIYTEAGTTYPFTSTNATITASGTLYGSGAKYGTFEYEAATSGFKEDADGSWPICAPNNPSGLWVAFGASGTASNPFNIIGFEAELLIEEPEY